MIDRAKLLALSLETLTALKASIVEVIAHKQKDDIRIGSVVTFYSRQRRGQVSMCVQNFGPKNLIGYEIDAHGNHLTKMKWRAHPSLVTLVNTAPKVPVRPVLGGPNDRPASGGLHAGMF